MTNTTDYTHLLSPGRIGSLELRNRVVLAAMGSFLAEEDGQVSERQRRFYVERAKGGVGLVTVEVAAVDYPRGAAMTRQLGISDDVFLPGLRDLTDRVHAHGAKISIQLQHAGKISTKDLAAGRPLSVPSADTSAMQGVLHDLTPEEIAAITRNYSAIDPKNVFRELDTAEIRRIIRCFAAAAARAQRAGFDGVEIHAGHGYLINEFLSLHTNRRQDAWGGKLENRARLLLEVLRETRAAVGRDFPVWCRLDGAEIGLANGITPEEARETGRLAEAAGADAIHVTCYGGGSGIGITRMIVHEPGALLPYAAGIKQMVDVPVIAVGRISPEAGEQAIASGQADFVAMARQLLAEPDLVNKLIEQRRAEARPCIHCYTCVGQIFVNEPFKCAVNPGAGREAEFALEPAHEPKTVLVVGGGPAGLEAARVAALRGHRVTLCEGEPHLGGALVLAGSLDPDKAALVESLTQQLAALPVDIRLGRAVTAEIIRASDPDVTVIATGASRGVSHLPGSADPRVWSLDRLRAHGLPESERVGILGGGLIGLELAELLAEQGRAVWVLEEGPHLGVEMAIPRRWRTLHVLREHGAELFTGIRLLGLTPSGVDIDNGDGERTTLSLEALIVTTGALPERGLAAALASSDRAVHLIGDCDRVGTIEAAMLAGARCGLAT